PTHQHKAVPTVYKVIFGKKYLIWKGKSLLQSCEILAKSISAGISKINRGIPIPETDYLYHVLKHIKSTRTASAHVIVEADDFMDEFEVIDGLKVLKFEQRLLDEADGDPLCLNNNEQAYVPVNNIWISQATKNQFLRWYQNRRKK
ncbi:MAG TPA: hypothetical protein PLX17_00615, partial [Chitinophagaceae bacterium]|nr:hypothetical protein [Chitinophagaceae bacterium]